MLLPYGKYRLAWQPDSNEFLLGAKTLSPLLPGDLPFHGFTKEADGMIIIGRERKEGPDMVMNPMWMAMFKVDAESK